MHEDDQAHDESFGHAVTPSDGGHLKPGDIIIEPGLSIAPEPLVGHDVSTPLDEDEPEHSIAASLLWAMKDHRHIQWHLLPSHERHDRIRETIGEGANEISVIDDGRHHAMVGRRVGAAAGGVDYCLVGRIRRDDLDGIQSNSIGAFVTAEELTLCGVAVESEIASSNIFDVSRFASLEDVPAGYLPGTTFTTFRSPIEITIY